MTKPKQAKKAAGRPIGSKTTEYPIGAAVVTRCIKAECGSTEKEPKGKPQRLRVNRLAPDGGPCNVIIIRRVRCLKCGQCRADREYRYE